VIAEESQIFSQQPRLPHSGLCKVWILDAPTTRGTP
jgi:hypothetical protein